MTIARVLSIAGSDPSGGAGIQADLKSISANGGYGMAAITALTAQNTQGVQGVYVPPASMLEAQLESLSSDISIDAAKVGMLANSEIIDTVATWLRRHPVRYVVVDPVMVATSGDRLLDAEAEEALQALIPLAGLITPNLSELGVLARRATATSLAEAVDQAAAIAEQTGVRVLAKGGHLLRGSVEGPGDDEGAGDLAVDVLVAPGGSTTRFEGPRIHTHNTHGTGCSLSSGIATRVAERGDWEIAVREAKAWLTESLAAADELEVGQGHGPIHHFAGMWDRAKVLSPSPDRRQR